QAGHLLGEYDRNGAALREYVWLRDTPMAMFMPDPANPSGEPLVYFIHSDHLNTPRVVVDRNNQVRWRWLAEPFGTSAPETNPSGLGVFTQNLRFPGQYADQESGLFYNYHRYYVAEGGQYMQSDPIGLAGGSLTTYGYVGGNPLSFVDAQGLQLAPSPFGPVPIPLPGLPTQSVIDPGRYDPVQDRYIPGTGSQPNTQECCTAYEDVYEANDGKHGDIPRGDISAEPANPTLALTHSVGAGRSRIGYDGLAGQIVVFRLTRTDEQKCIKYWHGYVVYQRDLTPQQWKAGRDAGFPNWPRKPK
ncbi:RHS repeat-associated core domain-containing protein, partial [Rhizobacter sp. P5_C2]